jgi:uncharacterized protein YydD (DUF2326 family)
MTTIEELKWEYSKIKEDLAVFRKSGKDVKVAELRAMQIPLKIKLAEITKLQKDVDKAEAIVKAVQSELGEVAESNEAIMLLCQQRVAQIKEAAGRNDMEMARAFYSQVREYFPRLSAEEKSKLLPMIQQVAGMIK